LLGATVVVPAGGKGSTALSAAFRLGAPTAMIGAVATILRQQPARLPADKRHRLFRRPRDRRSGHGVALIQVAQGDNGDHRRFRAPISTSPRKWSARAARLRGLGGAVRTPIAATRPILKRARAAGARTILNLAPFVRHADRLMKWSMSPC